MTLGELVGETLNRRAETQALLEQLFPDEQEREEAREMWGQAIVRNLALLGLKFGPEKVLQMLEHSKASLQQSWNLAGEVEKAGLSMADYRLALQQALATPAAAA